MAALDLNLKKGYHIQKPLSNEGGAIKSEVISMAQTYSKEILLEKISVAVQNMCVCQRKSRAKGLEKVKHHQHKGI